MIEGLSTDIEWSVEIHSSNDNVILVTFPYVSKYSHIFKICGAVFLYNLTDLSQILSLFTSTAMLTKEFLVDSKCQNTVIPTASTCTSTQNVFHDTCISNNGIN